MSRHKRITEGGISCPVCGSDQSYIKETRQVPGRAIRRRRICQNCDARYTTYETIQDISVPHNVNAEELLAETARYLKERLGPLIVSNVMAKLQVPEIND